MTSKERFYRIRGINLLIKRVDSEIESTFGESYDVDLKRYVNAIGAVLEREARQAVVEAFDKGELTWYD